MIYDFDLTGKTILLTGGYGYLGRAIAESLHYHGANLYVLGRTRAKFENAFSEYESGGERLYFQECDISDSGSIAKAFSHVAEKEGTLDVLINNAFYLEGQDPLTMSDHEWERGIDGTLNSVFRCIREGVPYLEKSSAPRIINVSSMYGVVAPDFNVYEDFKEMLNPPHYGAAKAGVVQISKYYASYLGKRNITVNTVTPGPFPPPSVQEKETFIQLLSEKTLLKRIGKPEDLAGVFVFLSSEASGYITGQNFIVDGGWTVS
jgi:NAD(P)-dependent dehydrogenase (short-subunit alcohol dehydrogenase family)